MLSSRTMILNPNTQKREYFIANCIERAYAAIGDDFKERRLFTEELAIMIGAGRKGQANHLRTRELLAKVESG